MAPSSLADDATNYLFIPTTNTSIDYEDAAIFPIFTQEEDTNLTVNDSNMNHHNYSQPPVYVIVIIVCAIIFLAFIIYMIYRCCTRNKHDKYYLPQENRLSSFHNPRTIMTPENLASYGNVLHCSHSNDPEVFTTYDEYRQPNVAYIPAAQPIAISNPPRSEHHSPPPSYEPPESVRQGMPPPNYVTEGYCPDSGNRLPTENLLPPPPEGYSHNSDEHITSRISLSSESTTSGASSSSDDEVSTPGNYLDIPAGNHISIIGISQQCQDNKDVTEEQQQNLNRFYI